MVFLPWAHHLIIHDSRLYLGVIICFDHLIVGAYDISSVLEEYPGSMEPRILKLEIGLLPECIIGGVDL